MARRFLTTAELSKIKFNQSPDAGLQQGEMIYDSEHLALMFGLSANVKMELGQSTVVLVYNDTLSSIPAGRAVYGVGVQNERPSVVQSVSSSMEQSSRTFGITAESIPAGGYGWVVTQGLLGGINTSSYLAGDELWLSSTTPGVLVTSSVGSPNYDLLLGYCVVSSATDGVIYVSFTRGVDVAGIHDIVLTDLASGDILRYNSASGYWENEPLSALGGGATVSETAPTSPSAGDFWFNSATAETFIYYDSTWVEVGEGGGSGLLEPVQGLDFDTVSPDASTTGRLVWDDGEGTLSFGLKGGNVDLQIGQENVALCYNGTGSSIPDGTVVYISGAQGQRPRMSLAQANAESTASKVLGITTETIANGAEGFVATFGIVNGLDTSAFTAGQSLYLSPTVAGGLTATKPVAPNHMVFVGYAISISASSGRIFVNPQNGYELDEIHDVLIGTKVDRDVVMYDSATGLWKNEQINLGTDTSGNYVASISTSDGISGGAAGSEGAAISLTNTDKGSSQNIFKNIAVSGQSDIVADSNNDTLNFAGGTGITLTTNATTDTLTITNSGVTSISFGTTGLTPNTATTGAVSVAGTLGAENGGTGQSSYTVGDLLYASTTTALSKLADVATGNALISGGVGVAPSWGKIGLTTHITGTLGVGNGGTGLATTPTNGQLLIGNGTNYTLATLTQGTGITVTNGSGTISIANAGVTGLTGTANEVEVSASTGSVTIGLPNDVTIGNNLTVTGTLTVNGTTTTVNSTTLSVDDPIITLGGDTAPVADDNKDRGIEFRYFDTQARLGFMGYDDSAGTFVFLTAATNTSEVFSGTKGTIDANISGSNINAGTVSATYIDSAIARLASPTFTGTVTLPLTTAGYVTTTSGGVIGSVATIPNAGLTNSSVTINGTSVSLGGSATVTAAAGTLTGTTLNSTVVSSSLTSVGTIGTGVWQGTAVGAVYGGTGQTTYTLGDILYSSAANTLSKLAGNTTTTKQFLSQTGTGTVSAAPSWSTVTKSDVGLANVENTALSTWAGSSNITTLGTVATGTWNATAIGVTKGGTGLTAGPTANGQLLIGAAAGTYTLATITQGTGITITNGAGSISIANAGVTSVNGSTGAVTGLATLASPTFTGTITTPLTTAGYVTTTSGGVLGSVATIPNAGLTNSSVTIGSTSVSLGGTATTVAGLTLTDPTITNIVAAAATAADLWSEVTTGSIAIGAGLTTGALNIATGGTSATPISIGHTNATIGITGNTTITGTLTLTGNLDTNLTTAGYVTTTAAGVLGSVATIPNAGLTNSSITVNGTAISLGGTGTVTAAAGTLTGTTLNATVTGSSLTSVGTITTGVWNAGAVTSSGTITGVSGAFSGSVNMNHNTQARPSTGSGLTVNWNYTGGSAEVDLWNVYTTATSSFSFKQMTGASTHTDLLTISPNGSTSGPLIESLRANRNVTGGGTITVDASYYVGWSARFIVISNGRTAATATSGYWDIAQPTSGTITGVGGAANTTATAAGIQLGAWQALYYILPMASANTSLAANFRVASYTVDAIIPSDWLLLAFRNGDNGLVYFNNGIILPGGGSWAPTADNSISINTQTTNYILALTDAGKVVETNIATANTVTVPPSGTVNYAIGTTIDIVQYGAGQTTITPGSGVTLRSTGGALKLSEQYSGATLYKRGTDEWVVLGDLTT